MIVLVDNKVNSELYNFELQRFIPILGSLKIKIKSLGKLL